jgi:hypothetical protein
MPRPKNGYRLKDGTEVPGTTTITGRFMDKSALLHWAFQQGKKGARNLYDKSGEALETGTVVHGMAELAMKGRPDVEIDAYLRVSLPEGEMRDNAKRAYAAFEAWRDSFQVETYKQEISLVSEQHRYGGTLDNLSIINGDLCLIDFKTSKEGKPYPDHLIQLAAYKGLWDENFPTERLTGGFHLVLLPKNGGKFQHYYYPQLRHAWSTFLLYRQAFELDKTLLDPRVIGGVPLEQHRRRDVRTARPVPVADKPVSRLEELERRQWTLTQHERLELADLRQAVAA